MRPVHSRRACDRCYSTKERCRMAEDPSKCSRCSRLGYECRTDRPIQRAGRRPHSWTKSPKDSPLNKDTGLGRNETPSINIPDRHQRQVFLNPALQTPLRTCAPAEKDAIYHFLNRSDLLDFYVLGPSFHKSEQQAILKMLDCGPPAIKDVYLACLGSLILSHDVHCANTKEQATLRRASAGLASLRSMTVTSTEDTLLCIALSTGLATFGYSIGSNVSDICSYCLSTIKPQYPTCVDGEADILPFVICLVFFETVECLSRRKVPTLRLKLDQHDFVDRCLGLCCPLLPYLYDICDVSNALLTSDDEETSLLFERLGSINSNIEKWKPVLPPDFVQCYRTEEVVNMLGQANVYRLAALLLIHRLRFPFTEEDFLASKLARDLLREIQVTRSVTKQRMRIVTFPFVVAAMEIKGADERAEVSKRIPEIVDLYAPVMQDRIRVYLSSVWRARDSGTVSRWIDLDERLTLELGLLGQDGASLWPKTA